MTLTQRRPQEGMAITARLSDEDGNITDTKWQWYRGDGTLNVRLDDDGDLVVVVGADCNSCHRNRPWHSITGGDCSD